MKFSTSQTSVMSGKTNHPLLVIDKLTGRHAAKYEILPDH
jgi:hypothetical protein